MLRIRISVFLLMLLAPGLWACAPRGTPAPLIIGAANAPGIIGGAGAPVPEYPAATHGKGSVVVQPGDTLYAISRYHQTALQALVEANNLAPPFIIKPGQVLRLPGQLGQPGAPPPPAASAQNRIASTVLAPPVSTVASAEKAGTTPVTAPPKPPLAPERSRAASVVSAPAKTAAPGPGEDQTSGVSEATQELADYEPEIMPVPKPVPVRQHPPAHETQEKEPTPRSAESQVPPMAARGKDQKLVRFIWPAKGPILSDFGPKQNGLHNDGINIAMPPNGAVYAAGEGVVSYAGNGLRGYGNLLLIRHEGGWMTAYAHNAELLVKKGDSVARGQLIARAGRSGGVTQDQLHFEIRQGTKAVNPKPLLVGG